MGSNHRLSGWLLKSRRGLLLHTDEGAIWALDLSDAQAEPPGERVRVEGIRTGFDRLAVQWIAPVPD